MYTFIFSWVRNTKVTLRIEAINEAEAKGLLKTAVDDDNYWNLDEII